MAQAVRRAGAASRNWRRYSDDELIDAIRDAAEHYDQHQLAISEYQQWRATMRPAAPTSAVISARRGWRNAVQRAGLIPVRAGTRTRFSDRSQNDDDLCHPWRHGSKSKLSRPWGSPWN